MRFEMRQQVFEDRLLDGLALGRRLDHQIGPGHIGKLQRRPDAAERGLLVLGGDLCPADLTLEIPVDQRHGLVERLLADIAHHDVEAREGENMGDPVAHLARADDPDRIDIHAASPFPDAGNHRHPGGRRARSIGRARPLRNERARIAAGPSHLRVLRRLRASRSVPGQG